MFRFSWRGSALALAMAAVVSFAASAVQLVPPAAGAINALDTSFQDEVLRARPADAYLQGANASADPRSFITIVAIDERTLAELGAYNGGYPRSYHAQVIENLLAAPPRVIALDLGFFEPTADDAALADAIDHARNLPVPTSVILGGVGLNSASDSAAATNGAKDGAMNTTGAELGATHELAFGRALMPLPQFDADVALANMEPDQHGTVRSMPLVASVDGAERPTLGLAAMAKYLRRPRAVDARPDAHTLQVAGRDLPVDDTSSLRINFFGPPSAPYQSDSTFRVVSFVDVLRGRIDPNVWRGGLVFVGALGATGLADDYWTPVSADSRKMAGVEIHANVAATLFSTQFLRAAPSGAGVALAFVLALLIGLAVANLRIILACALAPALMVTASASAAVALYSQGWLLPLALPVLSGTLSFVGMLAQRVIGDRRNDARHDALTGLPNRVWLVERLRGDLHAARAVTLLLINVERLTGAQDQRSDRLLREVARRLRRELPKGAVVARLGDEFAVSVKNSDADAAMRLGRRIIGALHVPMEMDELEITTVASIGVVVGPEDGGDAETLLRRAELAMSAAQTERTGCVRFTSDLDRQSAERLTLIADLPRAVANDELVLFCQPKIDCRSGALAGVEALVRWEHPRLGLIAPDRFISLAEESGTIGQLTHWMLNQALRQSRHWLDRGLEIPIAVNLSAHDFDDPDLASVIRRLLARWSVPPWLLSIEITETAVLADPARAMDVLSQLGAIGVRASLDDFGTGYSSLSAIKHLPLYELKIDRSFVRDMSLAQRDRAIVRSTIELGHSLGLTVVAEGVEDESTFRLLGELGCDLAQGYLFARPLPAIDLADWLRRSGLARPPRLRAAAS